MERMDGVGDSARSPQIISCVSFGIRALPICFPLARAFAIPAFTRSDISELLNWAREAMMEKRSSPCGVVVSTFS